MQADWNVPKVQELQAKAHRVRQHILRLSTGGGCFTGASLSAVEIILYLYEQFLQIASPTDPDRDYFFLSKGHDVPALYGVYVETGRMPLQRLSGHLHTDDSIYWHPNRNVPGVEFHSGSLGHLLPVACGVAYEIKLSGKKNRVVVVVGDGELDEGSNWEALLIAHAKRLDNLVIVVDRNEFQANVRTEELLPLEPLDKKFEAFGARAVVVDGHDLEALHGAFSAVPFAPGFPSVVIARTVRGKGVPSIEARADRWFCNFSAEDVESLLKELGGGPGATLESETLVVR